MLRLCLALTLLLPFVATAIEDAREVLSTDAAAKSSVQLMFKHKGKWETCSGNLVSSNQILTAGHCIDWYFSEEKEAIAIFGTTKFASPDDAPIALKRKLKTSAKLHPKYDTNDDADQALVKISGEVPAGFTPIKVLRAPALRKMDLQRVTVHAHGFGPAKCYGGKRDTKKLRKRALIDLTIIRNEKKNWMTLGATASLCQGDSGGAVIIEKDNQSYLAAINVSGSEESAEFVTIDLNF